MTTLETPTDMVYQPLQDMFLFVNEHLFGGEIPNPVVTIHNHGRSIAYAHRDQIKNESTGEVEIWSILNFSPMYISKDEKNVFQTMVHEACHLHGFVTELHSVNSRGYHCKKFAKQMLDLGLEVFNVNDPSKNTGTSCSDRLIEGGLTDQMWGKYVSSGLSGRIKWCSNYGHIDPGSSVAGDNNGEAGETEEKEQKRKSKIKYVCEGEECQEKIWAKPQDDEHKYHVCGSCYVEEGIMNMLLPTTDAYGNPL